MKLIQDVTSKANTVIQELHNTLTAAEVEKLPRYHPISHFAIKNGRRKMEDRHVIIHDLSTLYGLNVRDSDLPTANNRNAHSTIHVTLVCSNHM